MPADLNVIGMPGCKLYISADILLTFVHVLGNSVTASFPVPNVPSLTGVAFGAQVLVSDRTATKFKRNITNMAAGHLGK